MKISMRQLAITFAFAYSGAAVGQAAPPRNLPDHSTLDAAIYRGEIVFKHYCMLCHGINGDGNGRAAKLYKPRPANLVTSDKNPQYKELIVRQGGAALGRSEFMPPWNNELSEEQITDVVAYLGSIVKKY